MMRQPPFSVITTSLILFISVLLPISVHAQFNIQQGEGFNIENELSSGFSEDGRVKVLLLTLAPSGMTETASVQIGKAIEMNLVNTNHFTVVGPTEWNAQLQSRDPNLADCHDISCGIMIGKLFNADKVLVGQISAQNILNENAVEVPGFVLSIRMLDVVTNIADISDEIQFTDETMQDELFKLAVRISENTQLRGRVLTVNAKSRTMVVDLGRAHGLNVGDQMVVYTQGSTTDLEGQTVGLEKKNIGIAQILRLNDMSSDAIFIQGVEFPQVGHRVQTFVNRSKQIVQTAEARKEIDTHKRITPRERPMVLKPELIEAESGKSKWAERLAQVQSEKRRWMFIGIGGLVATIAVLQSKDKLPGGAGQFVPILTGGVTLYGGYKFFKSRREENEILGEGRIKGYVYWEPMLNLQPDAIHLGVAARF